MANHLSTAVSELPDFVAKNRNVSCVDHNGSTSIYNADGSINTGHHPNWLQLSASDRKIVNDERSRLGLGKKNKGKGQKSGKGGAVTDPKVENQINQLKKANAKHKRTIASLKKDTNDDEENADAKDIEADAGDSFGGKAKKSKI